MERALVELAQHGDEEAFASLARMAGDRLMAVAFRILRDVDRAEDAVQQTIVTAWQDLPTLRDPDRFAGWLYRILVHACYAELRRERRRTETVRILPGTPIAQDDVLSVDDRDQLERAFRRLPPDQRAVFAFHHYLGMRLSEIAGSLDIPSARRNPVCTAPRRRSARPSMPMTGRRLTRPGSDQHEQQA